MATMRPAATTTLIGSWEQLKGQQLEWAESETDEITWSELGVVTAGVMVSA